MRKIEFRGKDTNGNWHFGLPTCIGDKYTFLNYWDKNDELHEVRVKTETLGQFSGLRDKFGFVIYEGDIVLYECNGEKYYREIRWSKGGFKVVNDKFLVSHEIQLFVENGVVVDWEVVGNIFDSPELMK